jgi:hypothetical protein
MVANRSFTGRPHAEQLMDVLALQTLDAIETLERESHCYNNIRRFASGFYLIPIQNTRILSLTSSMEAIQYTSKVVCRNIS